MLHSGRLGLHALEGAHLERVFLIFLHLLIILKAYSVPSFSPSLSDVIELLLTEQYSYAKFKSVV
jgi:hypothetical protein